MWWVSELGAVSFGGVELMQWGGPPEAGGRSADKFNW